jgi:hypothetical protein
VIRPWISEHVLCSIYPELLLPLCLGKYENIKINFYLGKVGRWKSLRNSLATSWIVSTETPVGLPDAKKGQCRAGLVGPIHLPRRSWTAQLFSPFYPMGRVGLRCNKIPHQEHNRTRFSSLLCMLQCLSYLSPCPPSVVTVPDQRCSLSGSRKAMVSWTELRPFCFLYRNHFPSKILIILT